MELVTALTACAAAGVQDQADSAAIALSYGDGILGAYEVFVATTEPGSYRRSGLLSFNQAPLLSAVHALLSWASATDGARVLKPSAMRTPLIAA